MKHESLLLSRREILRAGLGAAGLCAVAGLVRGADAEGAKPGIKLGMVTYMVGAQMDLETLIGVCEKAKIDAVELRTTHKHGVEPTLDAAGRAKVRERFARTPVVLRSLGTICEFQSPKPEDVKKNIEEARKFIQLAADLKIWGVKVRPNGLPKGVPEDKTLKQIGTALRECGDFAKEKGIAIVVECHGSGTSELPRMAKIMEYCGHPSVGLCWNSNATDVKNGSIKENFKLCQPWIRQCHVGDLTSKKGYPMAELYGLLKEMKFDGYTLLETSLKKGEDPVAFLKAQRAAFEALVS